MCAASRPFSASSPVPTPARHWYILAFAIATACGGSGSSTPVSPPTADTPPAFDLLELVYRATTGFVVLDARASDPDGDMVRIECTGIVAAMGTTAVRDSAMVARTEEEQTVSVSCSAISSGTTVTREAEAVIPAAEPPPAPMVVHTFRVFDMTDHDAVLVDGTLTVTIDGQESVIDASNGVFELEVVDETAGGGSLAPSTVTAELFYEDENHGNSLRVLRTPPGPEALYGERIAATWNGDALSIELPDDDASFELFVAPDTFDRATYFRVKAEENPAEPHGLLCENVDPTASVDGMLEIAFLFQDDNVFTVAPENRDRVRTIFAEALPDELSSGSRFRLTGTEADAPPDHPFLQVDATFTMLPGMVQQSLDATGCVERMEFVTPIDDAGGPPAILSLAEARMQVARAMLFPGAADDSDDSALLAADGTFSEFARQATAVGVAIGNDPTFFQR